MAHFYFYFFFNLENLTCPQSHFRCNTTGRCIPWTWVCDNEEDCTDGSDEHADQGCLSNTHECDVDMFECLNHRCIDEVLQLFLFYSL